MGRWLSADPLAGLASDWSPYRYGFNNPIFYSDPLGLFETEASAKEYAKENGIKTGWFRRNRIKEQEDGSFAIENKNGTNLYDYGDELGGVRKEYIVEANSKEKEERDIASRQLRKETVMMVTGMVSMPGGGSSKGASGILSAAKGANLWKVGGYNGLRGLEAGLQAHHVGQKSLMGKFISGYNPSNAPSILVPEIGHVYNMPYIKRVATTKGLGTFTNARQVLARDIFELRRVYGGQGIPNSALQELIQLNKTMYPRAFIK